MTDIVQQGYILIALELKNDPLAVGYAGMTDTQAAASLNNNHISIPVDVPTASVINVLLKSGSWSAMEILSRDSKTSVAAHDNALAAAIALVRLVSLATIIPMTDNAVSTTIKNAFQALLTFGTITTADAQALNALTTILINRAQQIGWLFGNLSAADITHARSLGV